MGFIAFNNQGNKIFACRSRQPCRGSICQLQEFHLQPLRAVLGHLLSVSCWSKGANTSLYCKKVVQALAAVAGDPAEMGWFIRQALLATPESWWFLHVSKQNAVCDVCPGAVHCVFMLCLGWDFEFSLGNISMLLYPEDEAITLIDASVLCGLEHATCHPFHSAAFCKMKYLPPDSCRVFKFVEKFYIAY